MCEAIVDGQLRSPPRYRRAPGGVVEAHHPERLDGHSRQGVPCGDGVRTVLCAVLSPSDAEPKLADALTNALLLCAHEHPAVRLLLCRLNECDRVRARQARPQRIDAG